MRPLRKFLTPPKRISGRKMRQPSHAHFTRLPQALQVVFRPNDSDLVAQARALLAALG